MAWCMCDAWLLMAIDERQAEYLLYWNDYQRRKQTVIAMFIYIYACLCRKRRGGAISSGMMRNVNNTRWVWSRIANNKIIQYDSMHKVLAMNNLITWPCSLPLSCSALWCIYISSLARHHQCTKQQQEKQAKITNHRYCNHEEWIIDLNDRLKS